MTGCEQVVVGSNLFERNPAYDYGDSKTTKNAVLIQDCRDLTLSGLHLQGVHGEEAALVLDKCQRVHLYGCTILDSPGVGLLVKDCKHSRIGEVLVMRGDETPEDGVKITP
jgi:polygalacturonase